jgi:hypothetical protein
MKFTASGHENVLATHSNTLEFTKDTHLTKKGDCIVAVAADYALEEAKKLRDRVKITLRCSGREESLTATINPEFSDGHEMVIRKSSFACRRTFAINAEKAAADLSRGFVELLKDPEAKVEVVIECQKDS